MAITGNEPAQMTARTGLGRAGTIRAGVAPGTEELKPAPSGELIFFSSGGPTNLVAVWTTGKQA